VTPTKNRSVSNRGVKSAVMEYLHRHPDVEIWYADMAKDLGKPLSVIQACINNMISAGSEPSLERLVRGRSCIYRTKAKDTKNGNRVFEELAVTKAGELLIQDEAGTVYLAKEL
jgi:FMN-dependent NADH-azoreductase